MNIYKSNHKAFTLVELIIVIAILAILGTIAFISLQGYSTQARDSARISDMSSIVTSLELFNLDAGKYPLPTDWTDITYSGSVVWKQGSFGETVDTNTKIIDRIVLDPLTNTKYTYSVTTKRNEFEVGGIMEGDGISLNNMNNTYAGDVEATAYVKGNYNGIVTKSLSGTKCDLLSSPTIIASDIVTSTDVVEIINNERLVYNGFKNLPSSFRLSKFKGDGGFSFRPNKIVAYSDTNSCETITNNVNYIPRIEILKGIQEAYTGTILNNKGEIKSILDLNIDLNNPNSEVIAFGGNFVNNYFGGNVGISGTTTIGGPTVITLNSNGGTGGSSSVIGENGLSLPIISVPTRTGYIFNGYFSAPSGGTKYYNSDGTSAITFSSTSNITLYAQWSFPPIPNIYGGYKGGTTGYNEGKGIKVDGAGNMYVIGEVDTSTTLFGTGFISGGFIAKVDGSGNILWKHDGFLYLSPETIAIDGNGNVYFGGYYNNTATFLGNTFTTKGAIVTKFDTNGNNLWYKTSEQTSNVEFDDMAVDSSGNVYIAGLIYPSLTFFGTTTTRASNFVKFDTNGNLAWYKECGLDLNYNYGVSCFSNGRGLDIKDGNLYVTSSIWSGPSVLGVRDVSYLGQTIQVDRNNALQLLVAKLDLSGNTIWLNITGSTGDERPFSLDVGQGGDIYLAGWFNKSSNIFGQAMSTTYPSTGQFIAKLDNDGNLLWAKQSTGASTTHTSSSSIQEDKDGNILITGLCSTGPMNYFGYTVTTNTSNPITSYRNDSYLIKLNNNGDLIWGKKTYGGVRFGWKNTLDTDSNGNIYLAGIYFGNYVSIFTVGSTGTYPLTGVWDIVFVKVNSLGNTN
ncbi:MAG: InlB B-repeat-containing protein [Candidatus Gracilibacteria bacterium]|nr:InlB B-repeat-containing protein [Candidatus Gracilibacteria bacterium]